MTRIMVNGFSTLEGFALIKPFSLLCVSVTAVICYVVNVYCSGGRDLTGNKRTNKDQAFDQQFTKSNAALRISCKMGYPVRVVRFSPFLLSAVFRFLVILCADSCLSASVSYK